jgi:hypothetical protein
MSCKKIPQVITPAFVLHELEACGPAVDYFRGVMPNGFAMTREGIADAIKKWGEGNSHGGWRTYWLIRELGGCGYLPRSRKWEYADRIASMLRDRKTRKDLPMTPQRRNAIGAAVMGVCKGRISKKKAVL